MIFCQSQGKYSEKSLQEIGRKKRFSFFIIANLTFLRIFFKSSLSINKLYDDNLFIKIIEDENCPLTFTFSGEPVKLSNNWGST